MGKASSSVHQTIARLLNKVADKVILTNDNFAQDILAGAGKEFIKKYLVSNNEDAIKIWLSEKLSSKWLILFEGRVPLNIKNFFRKI